MLYKKYKMANGGLDPSGYMMAGQLSGSVIEGAPDEYGIKKNAVGGGALKGAGTGAAMGAAVGLNPAVLAATGGLSAVIGPVAGAIIGGTAGGVKANNEQKAARTMMAKDKAKQYMLAKEVEANKTKAFWTNNPNFKDGTLASSYFRYGGTTKELAGSNGVEFKGPSHEQGGIDLGGGIEVEGNETMDKGFIFSHKLGFASKHKKLMNTLDKLDKKPVNPATARTAAAIKDRIENLKVEQETAKSVIGLPNDIDGSSGNMLTKQYAFGGSINGTEEDLASAKLRSMRKPIIPGTNPVLDDLATLNKNIGSNILPAAQPNMKAVGMPSTGVNSIQNSNGQTSMNIKSGLELITPYISNLYANKQIKALKEPPAPTLTSPVVASQVDYEGAVQEARNQARAGRQLSERYLSSGSAIAATTATSGIEATKAITNIQKEEQNANAALVGQANQANVAIEAANNALSQGYANSRVEFANAKASANMDNISNATEKLLMQLKDSKNYDMDKIRLQLAVLSDMEGVSARNLEPVLAKIFKKGSKEYKEAMAIAEERASNAKNVRTDALKYNIDNPSTPAAKTSTPSTSKSTSNVESTAVNKQVPTKATVKSDFKPVPTSGTRTLGVKPAVKPTGDLKEITEIKRRLSPDLAILSTPAEKAKLRARLKELEAVQKAADDKLLKIDFNKSVSK